MAFQITNIQKSTSDLMRTIGYMPAYFQKPGEISIVRQMGRNDYPRFHAYVSRENPEQEAIINLHLDQKKPIYKGTSAHSGEYDGELVEKEAERIKKMSPSAHL